MQEDQYIHHDDNVVEYFRRYITKEGHTMWAHITLHFQTYNKKTSVQFSEGRSIQVPSRWHCRSRSFVCLLWNQGEEIHHGSHSTSSHFVWPRNTQCKHPIISLLQLLTLSYTQSADILRMRERYQVIPQVQIKRARAKIHEDSPDVADTQKRMSQLKMV